MVAGGKRWAPGGKTWSPAITEIDHIVGATFGKDGKMGLPKICQNFLKRA